MQTSWISLDGRWHVLPVEQFRQGFYAFDQDTWAEQDVPAHWQQNDLFEYYTGKMVYRRTFTHGQSSANARHWLRLNGIFYHAHVYLNSADLGGNSGYFAAQEYEITHWLVDDNTLIVEVDCPEEQIKNGKQLITGVFSHWDCIDPATNPGGIWRSVEVITTGPTRINEVLLDTASQTTAQAEIRFRVRLDAAHASQVRLRWTIAPTNFAGLVQTVTQERTLATGAHEYAGSFPINDPQLWWTHDLGDPNCYTITLDLLQGGEISDSQATMFGIRQFTFKQWIGYLNGVRLFIKGSNYAPGDTRIATMTRERCEQDLRLACECHMNLLRVHGHVDIPELYQAANLAGVLLWQDFPLQWQYQRAIVPEAERQVRQMIRQLYNHPSVVIWCMHNEPFHSGDTTNTNPLVLLQTYSAAFGFTWNRDVLDTRLKQVAEAEDATRPVVRSSGEYAIPGVRSGTDTHFYYGWYTIYGRLRAFEAVAKRLPANIRFVTEFGAQSFPNEASCRKFMDGEIATIDWQHLSERHQFQGDMLGNWVDWRRANSLGELIALTQNYQSALNRFHIDRLRLRKYKPTGGIVPFMFHDPNPGVLWSVLDYWREPKTSYYALRLAFSPQYAFTLLATEVAPVGTPIELPIYLVNDAHAPITITLTATLCDEQDVQIARVERTVTLPADCLPIEIERLRLTPQRRGTYILELAWLCAGEPLVNRYEIVVA